MSFPAAKAAPGVIRQVIADSPELMVVSFTFEPGAVGARHSHPHVQSSFVRSGRFAFEVGDDCFEVGPGEALIVPSGVEHGCRALEAGVLVDSFTPRRDDYL